MWFVYSHDNIFSRLLLHHSWLLASLLQTSPVSYQSLIHLTIPAQDTVFHSATCVQKAPTKIIYKKPNSTIYGRFLAEDVIIWLCCCYNTCLVSVKTTSVSNKTAEDWGNSGPLYCLKPNIIGNWTMTRIPANNYCLAQYSWEFAVPESCIKQGAE